MCKRWVFIFIVLAVLHDAKLLYAQFTDPRYYDNSPVGVNQIELDYAYGRANASIDTSLIVEGAKLNLNQETVRYTRYFNLFDRTAWAQALVPIAGLDGSVTGTNIGRSIVGAGDSSYELAVLLKGGPALSLPEFANYRPTTSVGASLTITAPTGLYNSDKALNLGSDRWSFKPEIGLSHPFGPQQKWVVDAYANASFFTDNTSYQGREILGQEALTGLEGHISYSFTPNLWAAFDTRYSFRGNTFVNGVDQDDGQQNFVLGSEVNISVNPRNVLVLVFAKALVHQNGPAYTSFSVKYVYSWGKGYKK